MPGMLLETMAKTSRGLLSFAPQLNVIDMHCHLGFYNDPHSMAHKGAQQQIGFFSGTVTPEEYVEQSALLAKEPNVRVGLGFHPWWVKPSDYRQHLQLFDDWVQKTSYISEIGLDFSSEHVATKREQIEVLSHILQVCSQGSKVLSVHSVRAASTVLDLLEQYDMLAKSRVIFHWFSGTSQELHRAVKLGCYFSVGERFLSTKRAKEYLKIIPQNHLLLETDFPPKAGQAPNDDLFDSLHHASTQLLRYYGLHE